MIKNCKIIILAMVFGSLLFFNSSVSASNCDDYSAQITELFYKNQTIVDRMGQISDDVIAGKPYDEGLFKRLETENKAINEQINALEKLSENCQVLQNIPTEPIEYKYKEGTSYDYEYENEYDTSSDNKDSYQVIDCPENSYYNGTNCSCNFGYENFNNQCIKTINTPTPTHSPEITIKNTPTYIIKPTENAKATSPTIASKEGDIRKIEKEKVIEEVKNKGFIQNIFIKIKSFFGSLF